MIVKSLILSALCTLGTFLLLTVVVLYDPPAIIGFAFGLLCGAGWMGIMALIIIRKITNG